MLVRLPKTLSSAELMSVDGSDAASQFSFTLLSCVMFTDSLGSSRKAPIPPVAEPAIVLIPRRIWGVNEADIMRDRMAEEDWNGRAWKVVSLLWNV